MPSALCSLPAFSFTRLFPLACIHTKTCSASSLGAEQPNQAQEGTPPSGHSAAADTPTQMRNFLLESSLCSGAGGPRGHSCCPLLSIPAVLHPQSITCLCDFMVPLHSDLHRLTTYYVTACGRERVQQWGCPSMGTTHCCATPQPCRLWAVPGGGTPVSKPHPLLMDRVCPDPTVVAGSMLPCPCRVASLDPWGRGPSMACSPPLQS